MAVCGEVGGCPAMLLTKSRTSCAVTWLGLTACCTPRLRQGSPAGEGGEAALPRGECSPVRCWRGTSAEGSCPVGCTGGGRGTDGSDRSSSSAECNSLFCVSEKIIFKAS